MIGKLLWEIAPYLQPLIVFYQPPEGSSYHLTIDSDSAHLNTHVSIFY